MAHSEQAHTTIGADADLTGEFSTPPHHTRATSPASSQVGQPIVYATFRPTASWLRIGPAWAVIAGALSLPLGEWDVTLLLRVLAALILADPIWGTFWHPAPRAVVEDTAPPPLAATHAPLPYAIPGSPATRLASWLRGAPASPGVTQTWHAAAGWPVALLLALLLGLSLGSGALALTAGVLGLCLLRLPWVRHDHAPPALLDASLVVVWPWLLGVAATRGLEMAGVAQAAAFGLLVWGVLRADQGLRFARVVMVLGQAAVLAVLVGASLPLAAGLVGACFVMPWWLLAWTPATPAGTRALRAAQPWLLAAMLLSVIIRS